MMKKWAKIIIWMLVVVFFLTACGGDQKNNGNQEDTGRQETGLNENAAPIAANPLDAVFDSGYPKLVATEDVHPVLTVNDLEVTDELKTFAVEMGSTDDVEAVLREALSDTEFTLISRAPDGRSGIILGKNVVFGLYNGKHHALFPAMGKGVEDTYGNLINYMSMLTSHIEQLLGEQEIAYSPDGRYAAAFNVRMVIQKNSFVIDPILIDLATGEAILTATWPSEMGKGAAAATSAVFSPDNRYLYYSLYGYFGDGNVTRVYRYDIPTGETELCFASPLEIYWPNISILKDGSLLLLNDSSVYSKQDSIAVASQNGNEWSVREYPLDQFLFFGARKIQYSSDSGYAILPEGMNVARWYAFHLFEPDRDYSGLNRYLCVAKETNQIEILTEEEFRSEIEKAQVHSIEAISQFYNYRTIRDMILSPDGKYLLLTVTSPLTPEEGWSTDDVLMVRLSDLSVQRVLGLSESDLVRIVFRRPEQLRIEWTEAGLIGAVQGISWTFVLTAGSEVDLPVITPPPSEEEIAISELEEKIIKQKRRVESAEEKLQRWIAGGKKSERQIQQQRDKVEQEKEELAKLEEELKEKEAAQNN